MSMKNFFKWKDLSDFSNYSKDLMFFDDANKKVIGKMKYEFEIVIAAEFVGLKSKMHSIKKIDGRESNTAKEVSITSEFNEFKYVLFNKKIIRLKMKRIQAKKHKIGAYEIDKMSLSCFDDKRYQMMEFIRMLIFIKIAIIIKDIIMEKKCVDGKRL